jgi:hypothetical protein
MQAEFGPGSNGSGYAGAEVTKAPSWRGLVAWDVLLNNLSAGLFLVAALCELAAPGQFAPVARLAYPVAWVLLHTDLLLVLDLGDPTRFHHMLRVFKPSSPMSFGTWSLTLYSLALTLIVAIEAVEALAGSPSRSVALEWMRIVIAIVGLVPASCSVAYKGVLFSTSSQPGWKDARWLGGYLVDSTIMLGCAELLAISILTGHARAAAGLRIPLVFLLGLNWAFALLLFADLRGALGRIDPRGRMSLIGMLVLAGETLIPLGILLAGRGPLLTLAAVALIVLGSLVVRAFILKMPHALHEHAGRKTEVGRAGASRTGSSIRRAAEGTR